MKTDIRSPYGRKRAAGEGWVDLGNFNERFESHPPDEAELPRIAWESLNRINKALEQAQIRYYGGARITTRCRCNACRQ